MTHVMAKGANIPLTAAAVRAVLHWSTRPGTPDVDASALLLGPDGRVRSDADFVFYNQPDHPTGTVRHQPKQQTPDGGAIWDTVEVDLAQLPPEVDRVVLAGSAEGGAFPAVPDLRLVLHDSAAAESAPVAEFSVTDTGEVTALVVAELYRRNGTWKFRAVGQGYAAGLAALATEFGVAVEESDDSPQEPPAATPPAPKAPPAAPRAETDDEPDSWTLAPATPLPVPPAPAPAVPPMPTAAPSPTTVAQQPLPPTTPPPQHAPQQPGYGYPPQPAPQPTYGHPQQPYPANQTVGYGYPSSVPPQPGYGYPPPQQTQPGGYGYPQAPAYPQQPHQPPLPHQQPQQPPAPPQAFTLPPQGPQFQPR
ncbi:TerD family protein [Kitasatospora sp. NPDC001175]|uniref:TerD family protein n=1 Tax=Kitasatospora sp. NPDC001175 TaxID=3157103 RepID=UPI003CFC38B5